MKPAVLCLILTATSFAQGRHTFNVKATARLDDIARRPQSRVPEVAEPREAYEPVRPQRIKRPKNFNSVAPRLPETPVEATASNNPGYSGFPALLDNFTAIPPDTNGAVGPQHVVTMLNTQMQIQSRTGALRANYPISLNAFWSPLGSFTDTFDPRIMYDAASDRWIATAAIGGESVNSALLVAVSQTGDPGGSWNMFQVNVGPTNWADYPVLGFNANWVVVSVNLFRVKGNGGYAGTTLYVFNKSDLFRNGDTFTTFNDTQGELIPAVDFDGLSNTMYFVQTLASSPGGTIRISRLQGPVGSESFRGANVGSISVPDGWSDSGPGSSDFGPQGGTNTKIDTGDSRLQNCVMRGGTIWCAHTIFLPLGTPTRSAVQWFQIDPSTVKVLQRGRIDDSSATNFYAYPSIAVNKSNDVLIGYSRLSTNDFASAEFAFRTASDPLNTLQPGVQFKHGESTYVSPGANTSSNRWGDFSATWVDPVDDLTFWTIQEYAATPPGSQRGRFGTFWATITAPSSGLNCSYALSSSGQTVGNTVTSDFIDVTTTPGCRWMAASDVPWLVVGAGSPATGSGRVSYTVASNPSSGATRTGLMTIAGQTFTITQGPSGGGPDLTVVSVSAPVSASPGGSGTVSAQVKNQGPATAGAFRIGLYLGQGPSISSRDTLLGFCNVLGLAAGASTNCVQTVGFASSLQPGSYVIGAIADDQNLVADTNRGNNTAVATSPITISASGPRPLITSQGVVNAASYQGGGVAPGEVVAVFGSSLGPAAVQQPLVSPSGVVGTIAGGTRLLFDGTPAPLIAVSSGLITAVVPFGVHGQSTTQVQVEFQGVRSDPISIPVVSALPSIFTQDASGKGAGSILNQDFSLNTPAQPASEGSTIAIYGTGGGFMQGVADGVLAGPPYVQLDQVSVRIGGAPAKVNYAGVAPSVITGVIQINAVIPAGLAAGNAVPIEVTINGVTSQAGVTLAIR